MHGEEPRHLARWVITQALRDAGVGSEKGYRLTVSRLDRDEARSFLFSSTGNWRQAREFWCAMADLDADELRRRSMRLLGLENEPEPARVFVPPAPKPPPRLPRLGSKLALLVDLLNTPEGISLTEMQRTFGWSRVTCSTAVSGDLPAKFGIRSKRGEDGRYRLVEVA